MGAQLVGFFSQAQSMGGLKAKMRLAMITGVSSSKADGEPDSPEKIEVFNQALKKIELEFK